MPSPSKKQKLRNILKAISPEDRPDIVVQELKEKVEEVIKQIPVPEDGKDGKDADEEKIIKKVLAQIPKPKDGKDGEPGKNAEVDVAKLKTEIKRDILSILPAHGGGNANREILVNSSVMSQSFTDINLLGSGVTISAANDNVNKRVNLTFTGVSGTAWGDITGTLSNQTDLQAALDAKFTLPSLTSGSVIFSNGSTLAQDNSNLFFDDTANTLKVTGGLISPKLYPTADSTSAIQLLKSDGATAVLTVDTTNSRVGIGTDTPAAGLSVNVVGHTDTFYGPGDLIGVFNNDSYGGRDAKLSIYHHYYPAGVIDRWYLYSNTGFAGGSPVGIGFGNLYGTTGFYLSGVGLFFEDANQVIVQSTLQTTWSPGGSSGKIVWGYFGGPGTDVAVNYQPNTGFKISADYLNTHLLTVDSNTSLFLPYSSSKVPVTIKGAASQSANLFETKDSSGNVLSVITASGTVGVLTSAPDKALEINHATGQNLRLTYNDSNGSAANYTDFTLSSSGGLTITPTSDFTISQNSVAAFKSVLSGATANTLYLKAGSVGINNSAPDAQSGYSTNGKVTVISTPVIIGTTGGFVGLGNDGLYVNGTVQFNSTAYVAGLIFGNNATVSLAGTADGTGLLLLTKVGDNSTRWLVTSLGNQYYTDGSGGNSMFLYYNTGKLGLNTTGADKQFEINSTSGDCLRLTYNDSNGSATNYADFTTSSSGDLTIAPSGGDTSITGTLGLSSYLYRSYATGITAGTTQTQGQVPLTKDINIVSTCANANDVVTLPAAVAGMIIYIRNNGAQTLQIFPASGDAINGAAADASTTLASGASVRYYTADTTNWYS